MQSVRNSSRMLQESFATGTAILAKYAEQREHLKVLTLKLLVYMHSCTLEIFAELTQTVCKQRSLNRVK